MANRVAFVWDNFGPLHVDRCTAVSRYMGDDVEVFGIEIFARSQLYDWQQPDAVDFHKLTLFADGGWRDHAAWKIARKIVAAVRQARCEAVFLCHYNEPAVLLAAMHLRWSGVAVFTMGCSKFDDAKRVKYREWIKRQFNRPYMGGIGSETRSTAYMRMLGVPPDRVFGGYNTVDQERIRTLSHHPDRPESVFASKPFLVVARLIPEKNFPVLLGAYAAYSRRIKAPRRLQIAGSGPLEASLKSLAASLGLAPHLDWLGFVQTEAVAPLMHDALCLILPSISETFGNVIPEALAVGLPVLVSKQCGAADLLVRDGQNGFTFDPDDDALLTELLERLGRDEIEWQALRRGAAEIAPLGDTKIFARSVENLLASR